MPKLLLASTNPGKLVEMQALLSELPVELLLPQDAGLQLHVEETGSTYAENAILKARQYAQASGLLSLGDDSGLEVEALAGAPGLYSARYLPKPGATDQDRRAYLIQNLQDKPRPWTAAFRCAVSVAVPGGEIYLTEGHVDGEIIPEERGQNGFGYDPIFLVAGHAQTMAELSDLEKNTISHRARAVQRMLPILTQLIAKL